MRPSGFAGQGRIPVASSSPPKSMLVTTRLLSSAPSVAPLRHFLHCGRLLLPAATSVVAAAVAECVRHRRRTFRGEGVPELLDPREAFTGVGA
ncbi:hypothetical protein ACFY4I_07805 [Streptomyces scabiei]|uniref:hypothetical protein n=1 Tax=Streptomyces scabiei TaxID=1930 RepID=UPI0036C7F0D9